LSLRVVSVSGVATVQDLGRPGHAHQGVPPGGAADALSLRTANRVAGNADRAAGVEVSMGRIEVEAVAPVTVVRTSGERAFEAIRLRAGEAMRVSPDAGLCRAYLAVAGGVDVPNVMGSRSTLASAGLGGFDGRALRVGDKMRIGGPRSEPHAMPSHVRAMVDFAERRRVLRVVTDGAEAGLPAGLWRVSPSSDRVGVRLGRSGRGGAIGTGPSRGVLHGTIQAPSTGELVILGPDGPTTGGYATVGTVIAADLPAVGQVLPGQWVRLEVVGREKAVELLRRQMETLDAALPPVE
jgi:biotin-dependent carboxylase-like uncharacterized protein